MTDEVDKFDRWFAEVILPNTDMAGGTRALAEVRSWAEDRWMDWRHNGTPLPTRGPALPGWSSDVMGPPRVPSFPGGDDEPFNVDVDPVMVGHIQDVVAESKRLADEYERQRQATRVVERVERLPEEPSSAMFMPAAWRELSCYLPIDLVPTVQGHAVAFHESGEPDGETWESELVDHHRWPTDPIGQRRSALGWGHLDERTRPLTDWRPVPE
jgi:hypothetical protein